jgi:hypothetical protein
MTWLLWPSYPYPWWMIPTGICIREALTQVDATRVRPGSVAGSMHPMLGPTFDWVRCLASRYAMIKYSTCCLSKQLRISRVAPHIMPVLKYELGVRAAWMWLDLFARVCFGDMGKSPRIHIVAPCPFDHSTVLWWTNILFSVIFQSDHIDYSQPVQPMLLQMIYGESDSNPPLTSWRLFPFAYALVGIILAVCTLHT